MTRKLNWLVFTL